MTDVCFKCTERHEACWSNCQKYKDAKAKHDAQRMVKQRDIHNASTIRAVRYHNAKWRHKEP